MINGIKDINRNPTELEVGQIRIGKKNSQGYPTKLDHFIIVDPENQKQLPVQSNYGKKPKRISVFLLHDDINSNFLNYYAYYQGYNKLRCRGDGEQSVWRKDNGSTKEGKCSPSNCKYYQQKNGCKINGILKVGLTEDPRLYAAYFFRTTSYYTVKRIRDSLGYISRLTGGILAGLELDLCIKEEKNDNGNMYIVHLEYPGDIKQLQNEAMQLNSSRSKLTSGSYNANKEELDIGNIELDNDCKSKLTKEDPEANKSDDDIIDNQSSRAQNNKSVGKKKSLIKKIDQVIEKRGLSDKEVKTMLVNIFSKTDTEYLAYNQLVSFLAVLKKERCPKCLKDFLDKDSDREICKRCQ
ncbi:recombination directionality factor [Fuchsiella alkaliacetigena]|uniref:recombination directionality factor n=1 Tax=Fuchsiella alkaliacetigena TaxID=957042 RepID=UPI002009EFBF|nr:hypothetical protein [Fuchsiella alkaliacetigena]